MIFVEPELHIELVAAPAAKPRPDPDPAQRTGFLP